MTRLVFISLCIFFSASIADDLQCGPGEFLENCPGNCSNQYCPLAEQEKFRCVRPNPCPKPACQCRFNYRRAVNGTCVPTQQCQPFVCHRPNEEYNPCPPLCPSDNCDQATPDGRCPLPGRILIVLECQPKCRCKKNFWRKDNICVPYEECPKRQAPIYLPFSLFKK